jgi:Ca-activated chloride channel homolog
MIRSLRAGLMAALLLGGLDSILGQDAKDMPKHALKPSQAQKPLSEREMGKLKKRLPEQYRTFIDDVELIITAEEKQAFYKIQEDVERNEFMDTFWRLRDPTAGTAYNEYEESYKQYVDDAKKDFRNLNNDQARLYLLRGPPDKIYSIDCGEGRQGLEPIRVWSYSVLPNEDGYHEQLPRLGRDVGIVFYQKQGMGPFVRWNPDNGLQELLQHSTANDAQKASAIIFTQRFQFDCRDGEHLQRAVAWMLNNKHTLPYLDARPGLPESSKERLASSLEFLIRDDPSATPIAATFNEPVFSAKGTRTNVGLHVDLPASAVKTQQAGDSDAYVIDVIGRITKKDDDPDQPERIFDKFRYRFAYPPSQATLQVIVDRELRAGEYQLKMQIRDANSNAQAIIQRDLVVPYIEAKLQGESGSAQIEALKASLSDKPSLRIVPPAGDMLTGLQHIETVTSGKISGVEFYLNGKKIAKRTQPPFELDLDVGNAPDVQHIKVVAYDGDATVAGDDIMINQPENRFRVRILSPRVVADLSRRIEVEVLPEIPRGESLESIALYENDTKVAELYGKPYTATLPPPGGSGLLSLVAKAKLKGKEDLAEDGVILNAPGYLEQITIQSVDMPVTVLQNGRPVADPGLCGRFKVADNGKQVQLQDCKYQEDIPLILGLGIDTSDSMKKYMHEVKAAATSFVDSIVRPTDRMFLIGFNEESHLIREPTDDLKSVKVAIATLPTFGGTALYDAISHGLMNFRDLKGRKAYVLITDGADTRSRMQRSEVQLFSERAGIPLYIIGIGDVESADKLASRTGGGYYHVRDMAELPAIYRQIQSELRAQYLLNFMPGADNQKGWHRLHVEIEGTPYEFKTIAGYSQ